MAVIVIGGLRLAGLHREHDLEALGRSSIALEPPSRLAGEFAEGSRTPIPLAYDGEAAALEPGGFSVTVAIEPDWLIAGARSVELRLREGGQERELPLARPSGTITLPAGRHEVIECRVDGWSYAFEGDAPVTAAQPHVRLRLVDVASFLVEGIDAGDRRPVDGLSVHALGEGGHLKGRAHANAGAAEAPGVVRVPVARPGRGDAYEARAPGRCARRFEHAPFGRRLRLALEPAASLEVLALQPAGAAPIAGQVRLELAPVAEPRASLPDSHYRDVVPGESARFDELAAGTYSLIARLADHGAGKVVARTRVHPSASAATRMELELAGVAPAAGLRVFVAGAAPYERSLGLDLWRRVDERWVRAREAEAEADADWRSLGDDVLGCTLADLEAGAYRVELEPFGSLEEVELQPGEQRELRFDVSDTCELRVLVHSAEEPSGSLWWGYVEGGGELVGSLYVGRRGEVRVHCRAAPIWLQAHTDAGSSRRAELHRLPGARDELTLEIDAAYDARLEASFAPAATWVECERWTSVELRPIGHGGALSSLRCLTPDARAAHAGRAHAAALFVLTAPGAYELCYAGADGRARRIEVDLDPGHSRVVLPLE